MAKRTKLSSWLTSPEIFDSFVSDLNHILDSDRNPKSDYLRKMVWSKLLDSRHTKGAEERRSRAISKWLDCEVLNRATSQRLYLADEEDVLHVENGFPVSAVDVLSTAKRFIREALGDIVPWDELRGSFTGGASTSIKRGLGTIARKYQTGTDITEAAIWPFLRLTKSAVWAPRDFRLVRGNVMFTVPKSSEIDRCAAKEPDYNMYAQKAVGDAIRVRLMRVGINLNDQTLNQRLSKKGSIDGSLATIDLSSASDSVTKQLVLMLLPDDWFYLMDDLRSPITLIDGVEHENVMFSSMGNAFTFELESLIFWGIVRACAYLSGVKGKISVYGDDIICPTGLYDFVVSSLEFCGFRVNPQKSFHEGPFRESCGKHWFSGYDITPFFVKGVPVDASDWVHLLNSLRRWSHVAGGICDPDYYTLWLTYAIQTVPLPVWGGDDLTSRKTLAAPGRKAIAQLVRPSRDDRKAMRDHSGGAYLHWLDASKDREDPRELETSRFTTESGLALRRGFRRFGLDVPVFPEELRA